MTNWLKLMTVYKKFNLNWEFQYIWTSHKEKNSDGVHKWWREIHGINYGNLYKVISTQIWTNCYLVINEVQDMPELRRLVAGFQPQRPRFEPRSGQLGFEVDKVPLGQSFLRVLQFHLTLIPPTAPQSSSSIIWSCYNRANSGQCTKWTQSHPTPRNWRNWINEIRSFL
jgi:hypothetical protein